MNHKHVWPTLMEMTWVSMLLPHPDLYAGKIIELGDEILTTEEVAET